MCAEGSNAIAMRLIIRPKISNTFCQSTSRQSAAHRDVATPWSSRDLENALRSNGIHKYNVDQLLTHDIAFNTSHVTYTCLNTSFNCDLSFLSDRCANVIDLITYDHVRYLVGMLPYCPYFITASFRAARYRRCKIEQLPSIIFFGFCHNLSSHPINFLRVE